MAEVNYQQAVQVLQDRLGTRWEGSEAAGRGEMVRVLKNELGCDNREANDTLEAMIKAGVLRYQRPKIGNPDGTADEPAGAGPELAAPGSTGQAGAPTIAGFAGAPAAAALAGIGYWQIGRETSEAPGRKGQVSPT